MQLSLKFVRSLGFAVLVGWFAGLYAVAAPTAGQQQSGTGNRKVIGNRAEYDAYEAAVNIQDAAARAASLEAFAEQYPHSVALTDVLQQEMAAWQTAGEMQKLQQTARQLVAADAGNVRALGIVVELDRNSAVRGDMTSLNELCLDSTGGMREVPLWQKPNGMSDSDFTALQNQMISIFDGAAGYCAWQQKNYTQAQDWLSRAFALEKTDAQDAYQLAVVDFEMKPLDADGFWYCARAIKLTQAADTGGVANAMSAYCRSQYVTYHGGVDGWDAVLAAGATQDAWPANFGAGIKPAAPAAGAPKSGTAK